MALTTVRLSKGDSPNWGFRLQGGKDFGTPLVIQKVNGGSPAERAGLIAGDAVIKINHVDVYNLLHKEAQDVIVRAGNSLEMVIQRGGSTWKPSVLPTGTYSKPSPSINNVSPVTKTSLAATRGENIGAIGTGHNLAAKPFGPQVNGAVNGGPKLVNKQYNTPLKLYSEDAIAETISAQSEVLSTGALGVNFKKNEKNYDSSNSAVYRMLQEAENDPTPNEPEPDSGIVTAPNRGIAGLRHVTAPQTKPAPSNPQLPPGQNICAECERLIVGVFVRIKEKNLHVECFKCATCGSSLKNVGYYNINNKLYCDIHAKSAAIAINNPSAVPVTIQPGVKAPVNAISAALSGHSLPSSSPLSPKAPSYAPSYPLVAEPKEPAPLQDGLLSSAPVANLNSIPSYESNIKPSSNSLYNPSAPLSFSKFINKSSNIGGARPFGSVSAPISPGGTLPRAAPLSPQNNFNKAPLSPAAPSYGSYSPSSTAGHTTNITWPPSQEDIDLPTACPLFYPPPSKVEAEFERRLATRQQELKDNSEEDLNETMSFYSEELSFSDRRSATECVEILTETLDTEKLVENVIKSSPNLVPPSLDIDKNMDSSELKRPTQYTPNTIECQLPSVIENTVPQKWESALTQAVRTTAPDSDTFCRISSRRTASPMASALAIAPTQPFNPLPHSVLDPVPLPKFTEAYFPPERPVLPIKQEVEEEKKVEKQPLPKPYSPFVKALEIAPERPFTSTGGPAPLPSVKKKPKDPLDKLIEDLPKPSEPTDMRAALTTAPERSYTPIGSEHTSEAQTKRDSLKGIDRSQLIKPLKPEELPASFQMNKKEPKPPSYYAPVIIEERINANTEETLEAKENKHVKIIETETIQPGQVTQQLVSTQDVAPPTTSFAPIFQGFTCSFKNKTDHSQFSVEVCTTPPVPTPPPKPQTPISYIATVEERPARITREKIIQEDSGMQQTTKRQEHVSHQVKVEKQRAEEVEMTKHQDQASRQVKVEKQEVQKQAEEVVQVKTIPVSTILHRPETLPSYQVDLQVTAEADLLLMEKKRKAEERLQQQKIEREMKIKRDEEVKQQQTRTTTIKPIITIEPGDTNNLNPKIHFQPVLDESKPASTTFSPRPRSITPSMITKAPPLLPYYQESLVHQFHGAIETNMLDPTRPEISRSPSPCPCREPARSRSPSPFPSQVLQERARSPAEGPPPNPLQSLKPLPTPQDSRIQQAKESLKNYIPEYKSQRDLVEQQRGLDFYKKDVDYKEGDFSQNVAYPGGSGVQTGNVQQQVQQFLQVDDTQKSLTKVAQSGTSTTKTDISEKSYQEQLAASSKTHIQNNEISADGLTQVQRKKVVTEEFERSHKETNIQIETSCTNTKYPFSKVNVPSIEPSNVQSFHVTNPHQRAHPQLPDSTPPQPPIRKVFPPGSLAPIKHVTPPSACQKPSENVTKSNIPIPDVGAGTGRQIGGIVTIPKRGRGTLNTAAIPGARVPLCGHCHGQIRGPFITALGKIWCPQHFVCSTPSCRRPLQDLGFVEERGQLYCEYCFEQYLAPPCSKCNSKIKGDCLKAIGKNFHPECFNCAYCGKLFGNNPFFLEEGNPYCEADWNELFTTKCFACGFPVEAGDRWVEALNNNYHSQCFNCTMCKKNLEGQSFFAKGGRPFCKNHAR